MAGRIITNSPVGAADWTDEVETKNIGKKGLYNMAFTNMLTDGQPEIIAGSSVDVDGVIIVFDSNETITGSVTSGAWYVVAKADGTAEFIDETPIFDDAKKGYYDTLGNRVVLGFTNTTYSDKTTFTDLNKSLGDINAFSLNTGQGANKLYDMDQNVKSNSNVVFSNIQCDNDLTINGNIENTENVLTDQEIITSLSFTRVFPRGIYSFGVQYNTGTAEIVLQKNVGDGWYNIKGLNQDGILSECCISNGSDTRIVVQGTGSIIAAYSYFKY